jgi:Cd2+/Zn2+-exporting ATPase
MTKRPSATTRFDLFAPRAELTSAVVSGALLVLAWLAGWLAPEGSALAATARWLPWVALSIGAVYGGKAALESVREFKFDIDALMFVGAVLAAFVGAPSEGALLLCLFSLSGALEELAMERTTRAVTALSKLMPTSATRWENGAWVETDPANLVAGDRVLIRTGEQVPADAQSLGATAINTASLTGESVPREVEAGDELFAGTINAGDAVEAVVTRPAAQSSLQKIVDLVTTAQKQRQPVQRLIDRWSQPYALCVVGVSVLTLLVWRFVLGVPWVGTSGLAGRDGALYAAITLLIVASPCALIIATPTATLAAISRAAKGGVLFKGGQALERLARLRAVAFDKTGTLTIGRPRVLAVHPVAWSSGPDLLAVAAGLEQHATHPIAAAIVECAKVRGVDPVVVEAVKTVAGRGMSGVVLGQEARLGSLAHTEGLIPVCLRQRTREVLATAQGRGQIGVVCAWREQVAVLIMADPVRPGAECLVERLHGLGIRPVVMLTGDNALTAKKVADALKLDAFHADLMPGEKVAHVARLKRGGGGPGGGPGEHPTPVGVIGDGINDAPALAAADASIAIGSIGSDAALESADCVLLSDDLSTVPWAVDLARRTRQTIRANLLLALGAIVLMAGAVLLSPATGARVPLWLGVVGHEGGTLLVVLNALRLLAFRGVPVCNCPRHGRGDGTEGTAPTVPGGAHRDA